jgi:cullin 2
MSEVEVKLNYLKSTYTITMNTFQVAMLIAFQHTDAVTCEELLQATRFKPVYFERTVRALLTRSCC